MFLELVYQSDSFKESFSHGSGLPPPPLYPIFFLLESGGACALQAAWPYLHVTRVGPWPRCSQMGADMSWCSVMAGRWSPCGREHTDAFLQLVI